MDIRQQVKSLIDIMDENSLSELEIEDTNLKVKICLSSDRMAMISDRDAASISDGDKLSTDTETAPEPADKEICSPLVGIFHLSPEGKDTPYVKTGSIIQPSQVLGRVRVVDIDNEIRAEVSGVITEILIKDGQPVEYDQPLFSIEPS
ncbi:biotin/lipoyl-binding protein [Candidatus Desantisbacteria bacterium]|nr:biotin/lipoyl-binding protein [Candidatus Desantisbacteria bacterium]